ncbi:hypothetical protein M405DRAFT_318696 [Rhizopogon salebrosus TDB-379]|nr:hypothetical protein M405DRAFT_318696 [Rhizopogon salebrosus TDB-379]
MARDTSDRHLKRIRISLTNNNNHVIGSLRDPFQKLLSWSSMAFGTDIDAMQMYSTSNEDSLDQGRVAYFKRAAIYDEKNWEDLVDYVAGEPGQYVAVLLHAQPKASSSPNEIISAWLAGIGAPDLRSPSPIGRLTSPVSQCPRCSKTISNSEEFLECAQDHPFATKASPPMEVKTINGACPFG